MAAAIPAAASGVMGMASSAMGAYGQEKAADEKRKGDLMMNRENLAENARQFNETTANRKMAYENALKQGGEQMSAGESGFMSEANTASPELAQMKKDILSGESESLNKAGNEMNANLSAQGVRGGQAATQLKGGLGEMGVYATRDINQMIGSEGMQREAEKRAYLAAKAGRGQTATLSAGV